MKSALRLQGAIFDLDGVITDTAAYHYQAWRELAQSLDLDFDRQFNESLKGVGRMESLDMILAKGGRQLTLAEKQALAKQKNERYLELIKNIGPADLLPGVGNFLYRLQHLNIKMAVASASKNAQQILRQLDATQFFQAIADPGSVARGKPAPDLFLKAAALIQADPQYCIGFEDAVAGVESIRSAGMWAVGIGDARTLHQANLVLPSTAQLDLETILADWTRAQAHG